MLNIDRIKEMDAEELIIFMNSNKCDRCSYQDKDCGSEMCSIGMEEWLNQETQLTTDLIHCEFGKFCNKNTCGECKYPNDYTCHYNFVVDNFNIIDGKITRRSKAPF